MSYDEIMQLAHEVEGDLERRPTYRRWSALDTLLLLAEGRGWEPLPRDRRYKVVRCAPEGATHYRFVPTRRWDTAGGPGRMPHSGEEGYVLYYVPSPPHGGEHIVIYEFSLSFF